MSAQTIISFARKATGLLCLSPLVFTVGCADATHLPTSPTSIAVGSNATVAASVTATATATRRPSNLLLTKTCGAESHCTVESSTAERLPKGTDIFYTGPLLESRTTSGIVITTPSGDTAFGHCSLSYRSFTGTCVLTGGTGSLSGVHASVKVTTDFNNPDYPEGLFTWEGTYHFAPAEAH